MAGRGVHQQSSPPYYAPPALHLRRRFDLSARGYGTGGNHAKKRKAIPAKGVASLKLGRYPFAAGIPYFMERKKGVWRGRTTAPTRKRTLDLMARTFEDLKARGDVITTDPRYIGESDIRAYADDIKRLDPETQAQRLRLLNDFLCSFGNRRMDDMIRSGEFLIPSAGPKPVRTMSADDLAKIFEVVGRMEGWTGSMCRGMCAIYFASGLRPSELRLAEYKDLDLKKERIFVSHPKGEGNWASRVWVDFIRADMMPLIRSYDKERAEYLRENGVSDAKYLFPNIHWRTGYYSENRFRQLARLISAEAGVDFSLKMFRSTLCSLTVNGDLSRLPAMGMQLRHSSPEITKKYYADIERGNVGKQLRPAWKETPIVTPMAMYAGPSVPNTNDFRRNHLDCFGDETIVIDFDNAYTGWEEWRTRGDSNPRHRLRRPKG